MKRIFIYFSLFVCFSIASLSIKAQDVTTPTYSPKGYSVDDYGTITDTITTESQTLNAPLHLTLYANPSDAEGWTPSYEWVVIRKALSTTTTSSEEETVIDRYLSDDETTVDIEESGDYSIYCYAIFFNGTDSIKYDRDYWTENSDMSPLKLVVATSFLEFPNAFSPNGDNKNDTYGPKGQTDGSDTSKAPKSIIEYHMQIFSRWGQKLFDTRDITSRWDGTFNGHDVREGVYYVLVNAKGADGVKYSIKKDVNLLRGIRESDSSTSSSDQ